MSVGEQTLRNYLVTLIQNERIQEFLKTKAPRRKLSNFHPRLSIVENVAKANASQYAGIAVGSDRMEISKWICVDKDQAFSTVRHELAHNIKNWCKLPGSHHGRGFTEALKIVSPRLWRSDRHWKRTPEVEAARAQINPRVWSETKERKYYIQIDNGKKFAWRQMNFSEIKDVFKKTPQKLWTKGEHCTRVWLSFNCKGCATNFYPTEMGTLKATYSQNNPEEGWSQVHIDNYLICPECEISTFGHIAIMGTSIGWNGSPKAWQKIQMDELVAV